MSSTHLFSFLNLTQKEEMLKFELELPTQFEFKVSFLFRLRIPEGKRLVKERPRTNGKCPHPGQKHRPFNWKRHRRDDVIHHRPLHIFEWCVVNYRLEVLRTVLRISLSSRGYPGRVPRGSQFWNVNQLSQETGLLILSQERCLTRLRKTKSILPHL